MRKPKSTNQKVLNATKIEYKGIQFRSKLELFTYKQLQEADIKADYEKHKFVIEDGFKYKNPIYKKINSKKNGSSFKKGTELIRPITYTPDFVKLDSNKKGFIIEVKGFATEAFKLKWKLFLKYLNDNGYDVDLYIPRNQGNVLDTVNLIKSKLNE